MGALYVKQLAEKTHRGLRGRVEPGRSGGGRSFGYAIVSTGHAGERGQAGELRINSAEAEIVRRIFKLYCDGVSPREIAKTLNREQVPGPSGGPWGPSTINGNVQRCTGILNNELYLGRMLWNRLRYVKDPSTGKRRSKPNPRTAWVIGQVPHLRIVSQDLWEAAKTRQQAVTRETRPSRGRQEFWKNQRPRYLLSGLMKCGVCGASYTKHGQSRFACAAFHDRGTCDNRLTIRGDEVEAAILDGLKSKLMSADLFEEFAREFTAEINRQRMTEAASLDATRRELIGSIFRSRALWMQLPMAPMPKLSTTGSRNWKAPDPALRLGWRTPALTSRCCIPVWPRSIVTRSSASRRRCATPFRVARSSRSSAA